MIDRLHWSRTGGRRVGLIPSMLDPVTAPLRTKRSGRRRPARSPRPRLGWPSISAKAFPTKGLWLSFELTFKKIPVIDVPDFALQTVRRLRVEGRIELIGIHRLYKFLSLLSVPEWDIVRAR